jgi:hypothetical protein
MAETESSQHSEPFKPTHPPPVKTPMYKAVHSQQYFRQELIKQIQTVSDSRLLCYVAGVGAPITRDDAVGIVELLHNVKRNSNVDLLLHSGGGDIDAAEKMVSILRTTVGSGRFRIIVPDFAKSAGTLMALAADKIVMSDSSELGPIDPQFVQKDGSGNGTWNSVLNYLQAYEELCKKVQEDPTDQSKRIMLSKLDPSTVVQFEQIKKRALSLAEKHLQRGMKQTNFTKIAGKLMDNTQWLSHGQVISREDAQQIGLEVEYLLPESKEWRSYWELYCLQRLAIKDSEKLFESDYASLSMGA